LNRPSTGLAVAVAGPPIGAAAISGLVAQTELSGEPHPHIWSNGWLVAALCLAGVGLALAVIFFVMSLFPGEGGQRENRHFPFPRRRGRRKATHIAASAETTTAESKAFTGRWRPVPDGAEASRLTRIARLEMPGISDQVKLPYVRVGVAMASKPLSGLYQPILDGHLRTFVRRDPVSTLIASMSDLGGPQTWTEPPFVWTAQGYQ